MSNDKNTKVDTWIKCQDYLPPVGENVLIYYDGMHCIAMLTNHFPLVDKARHFYIIGFEKLVTIKPETYWQPLPDPPVNQ